LIAISSNNRDFGFSLGRGVQLTDVLLWRVSVLGLDNTVERLVCQLDDEASLLGGAAGRMFDYLSKVTKSELVRHPYMAGHLRSDFRMSQKQFSMYVAKRILWLNHKEGQVTTSLSSIKEFSFDCNPSRRVKLLCTFQDSEDLPLLEGSESFTIPLCSFRQSLAISKLSRAFYDIARCNNCILDFIETYLWCLAMVENPRELGAFSSRSFQCLPGLALFSNPELSHVPSIAIEEALLHEAIHSFLFFAEDSQSPLLAEECFRSEKVTSPWTGSVLDLHTGVHAMVVWIVLAVYYRLRLSVVSESDSSDEVWQFINRRLAFVHAGMISPAFQEFWTCISRRVAYGPSILIHNLMNWYWVNPG
jgi:hypothetical protein